MPIGFPAAIAVGLLSVVLVTLMGVLAQEWWETYRETLGSLLPRQYRLRTLLILLAIVPPVLGLVYKRYEMRRRREDPTQLYEEANKRLIRIVQDVERQELERQKEASKNQKASPDEN